MAKKQEPPKPVTWDVYPGAHRAIWLANVVAASEDDAIERVANERNLPANELTQSGGDDAVRQPIGLMTARQI
jgi:hypothetical protein